MDKRIQSLDSSRRILVVDDDQDILESICIFLHSEGFSVKTTPHADEILSCIVEFKPHLILLDVLLSGYDGRQICKMLKQHPEFKHIPVMLLSAHPSVVKTYKDYGAEEFVAKPFVIEEFRQKIHARCRV
jgi:DNA-binding response OmpR family regulator